MHDQYRLQSRCSRTAMTNHDATTLTGGLIADDCTYTTIVISWDGACIVNAHRNTGVSVHADL